MTSESSNKSNSPAPENQRQRWAKYGSNVLLMTVLAVVVSAFVVYIVQKNDRRLDLTGQGVNSLKPQTLNILRDLSSDVRIVSLYTKSESDPIDAPKDAPKPVNKAAYVADLLDGYRGASSRISTEVIDPSVDKPKVDALLTDLEARYGKEIGSYKAYLESFESSQKRIRAALTDESTKLEQVPMTSMPTTEEAKSVIEFVDSVKNGLKGGIPNILDKAQRNIKSHLQDTHPDYKDVTSQIKSAFETISQSAAKIAEQYGTLTKVEWIPAPIKQYFTESIPHYVALQKLADDELAKIGKLGELKVNDLEQAMNVHNPVLVLGKDEWRVLSENQIWPEDENIKMYTQGKARPTFAGEQQITSAIVGVTQSKKSKIVFVRPGGPPLTSAGFPPFVRPGILSRWAERLRDANFDVLEKDLSGQWAMQAMQQQMPSAPEPDWTALTDAVWVVLDYGGQLQGPEPLTPKLAEHLGHGGSAIIVVGPQSDALTDALKSWGVTIHADAIGVHAQPPAAPGDGTRVDQVQEALRRNYVWDLKDYGTADLAQPIRNLESILMPVVVVQTTLTPGYTAKTLLPLPTAPEAPISWGETNITDLGAGKPPEFDPKVDIAAPIAAGAAVEKAGGGRLVVIGAASFAFDDYTRMPDPQIARDESRFVPRFPGNLELASNAAFWCAKMDSMIALSPSALQVPRIASIQTWKLEFWRVGVVLVLLPLAVLIAGVNVYLSRRD